MAAQKVSGGRSNVIVFQHDSGRPIVNRSYLTFGLKGNELKRKGVKNVPKGAAGFDTCRLDPSQEDETLIFIRKDGIYRSGASAALLKTETLFAHYRDDKIMPIKLCLNLFKGALASLVIPVLDGYKIYKQPKPGLFKFHEKLEISAYLKFFGNVPRHQNISQSLYLGLDFPDLSISDFNGDGLADLCFASREEVTCFLQNESGFSNERRFYHFFELLTDEERSRTNLRSQISLVHLNNDQKIDVIFKKSSFDLSDMQGQIQIFLQTGGTFTNRPTQTIQRQGYFDSQEFFDYDNDGQIDVIAPVMDLSWSSLAGMYLTKSMDVEFVWFKNSGGKIVDSPTRIREISFPLDFKNLKAFLGGLPIWNKRFVKNPAPYQMAFFPELEKIEVIAFDGKMQALDDPIFERTIDVGNVVLPVDLDGDGYTEFVMAYPNEPKDRKNTAARQTLRKAAI